jgi:ABC-type multidrug transport system fused ATPase/permease subunit
MHWKAKRSTLVFCGLNVIASVLLPFTGILLPKLVIDELTAKAIPLHFIAVIGAASAVLIVLNFLKSYTDEITNNSVGTISSYQVPVKFLMKYIDMDYELLENPDVKELEDKAFEAGGNNHTPANNIPRTLARLLFNLFGFLLYGAVITSIHPLILILLAISAVINWTCLSSARRYEQSTKKERSKLFNKVYYIQSITKKPESAKDIRLYSMQGWIKGLFEYKAAEYERASDRVAFRNMLAQLADGFLILVRDGAAYAFLVYLLLADKISLGDFVFVFSAIGAFAGWISGIILQTRELFRASSGLCDIRAYLEYYDSSNTETRAPLPTGNMLPPGISLRGVSYTYPKSETAALNDISLDIRPGERIAVVGANGAGKTTLIKLILGLYRPASGTVSLGGTIIDEYNRDEYFTLFSAVFQDIHLLPTDIAGNISQVPPEQTDYEKVAECLRLSGFYDKVQSLPEKERTMLVRRVNDDAIELSGGEKQKLALARALYKDAPVIILDEPTAALDPIAENEIYQKYADLTRGKTSIYISHRLASTRFCDRIILIDGHAITETGTHDELMRLGGKYAEMFEVQSHYYKQDGEAV